MTLEEFIKEEEQRIIDFHNFWIGERAKAPDMFPSEMNAGDWDDQYAQYVQHFCDESE